AALDRVERRDRNPLDLVQDPELLQDRVLRVAGIMRIGRLMQRRLDGQRALPEGGGRPADAVIALDDADLAARLGQQRGCGKAAQARADDDGIIGVFAHCPPLRQRSPTAPTLGIVAQSIRCGTTVFDRRQSASPPHRRIRNRSSAEGADQAEVLFAALTLIATRRARILTRRDKRTRRRRRSSRWRGPNRKRWAASGHWSVSARIAAILSKIQSRVGLGRRTAVQTEALNERLMRISPMMARIRAKNVSARTSSVGMPRHKPTYSTPATIAKANSPWTGHERRRGHRLRGRPRRPARLSRYGMTCPNLFHYRGCCFFLCQQLFSCFCQYIRDSATLRATRSFSVGPDDFGDPPENNREQLILFRNRCVSLATILYWKVLFFRIALGICLFYAAVLLALAIGDAVHGFPVAGRSS